MKFFRLFLVTLVFLPLACDAGQSGTLNAKVIKSVVSYYFGEQASVSETKGGFYVGGDFNADGHQDVAILYQPAKDTKAAKQVITSTPWSYDGNALNGNYHTSLAIINSGAGGLKSADAKVYAMVDDSGVLETPSFQLIVVKPGNKDYQHHLAMLPVKTRGDILILPTEAGIDTYIYWSEGKYKLYIPEEAP